MEKRIFVAIAVSIAFLWLWAAVAPRVFPELNKPPARPAAPAKPAGGTSGTSGTSSTGEPGAAGPVSPAVERQPATAPATSGETPRLTRAVLTPVGAAEARYITVDTPDYIALFSNRGAQLVSFQLKKYTNKAGRPVELVKSRPPTRSDFPFAIESASAEEARRLNTALFEVSDISDRGARVLHFRYAASDGLAATKTFRITPNEYLFDFSIDVESEFPWRTVVGPGIRNLDPGEEKNAALITGNGLVQQGGDLDVFNRESGDRFNILEGAEFVGIEDNYFAVLLRPVKSGPAILRRIELRGPGNSVRKELYAGLTAAPDGVVTGTAFFGPKETKLLDRYGFSEVLQYGMFGVIARFLLTMLVWINQYTNNYGFAIIVLTIIIKIVLYPLQHKSIVSMKKMQRVQPKMEAIKNKYKKSKTDPEQRQKMNVEMMKLYQVEGINPMSGCIPIVLQLPILWGFYNLLSRAIELRGAPFILWIRDLSEMDPYYITPILMTVTMFIQTWMTPATGDPAQRRIFLIMPVVFGYFFKEMPSGLVLYWLVQNVLTIIQQWIMNRWWKEHPEELSKD